MDYRYGSHTVFQIEYHFVWVTKYRYKVLTGEVAERMRELVRQTCEAFEIRIVRGVVSKDHVHGKVAQIHQLWQEAGLGELLPRAFAIDLAVARGFNPSAARTQFG